MRQAISEMFEYLASASPGDLLELGLVVPVLGLPAISVLETFAIGLVARVVGAASSASSERRPGEDSNARTLRLLLTAFFAPLAALFFGWIIRGFL